MQVRRYSYRHASENLGFHRDLPEVPVSQLLSVLADITKADILEEQRRRLRRWIRGGPHGDVGVGAQKVINFIINQRVEALMQRPEGAAWQRQVQVLVQPLADTPGAPPRWSMDFKNGLIGFEISFNNAGALPQNLLRFSLLSQSPAVRQTDRIRLGVLTVANQDLYRWGSMDSTVPTFDDVIGILSYMEFSLPTPILVLGLCASDAPLEWSPADDGGTASGLAHGPGHPWGPPSDLFLGHRKAATGRSQYKPFRELSREDKTYWRSTVSNGT